MLRRLRAIFSRRGASPARGAYGSESLLGRRVVNLDTPELQRFIAGKRVMVTGAGGSIGSEICRQIMRFCPHSLILLDRAEFALFEIEQELRHRWVGAELDAVVADLCDARRLERVFEDCRPQVVFHAAAHKHVPLMEHNPGEAVKNNVLGTQHLADAALRSGVEAFVLISTDKAVNPTSVMGATKRVAEMIVQSMHESSCRRGLALHDADGSPTTRFVAVRFGNVLGSSGSVVPIFRKQIAAGGPVTVTHPEMRRYFMTIPEAAQLVMQAGAIGKGGEVFVLDMGQPVRILDLAEQMIRDAGLQPGKDVDIRFSGVRPGEKLFEELSYGSEQTLPTTHRKIRVWRLPSVEPSKLAEALERLWSVVDAGRDAVVSELRACVPEYRPEDRADPIDGARSLPPRDQAAELRRIAAQAA